MSFLAQFSEGDNVGSIKAVSLAHKTWLTGVNPVAFISGKDWEDVDFVPEQGQLQHNSRDTENGTVYTYQVWFLFNKQNAALFDAFKKYIGQTGILKVTDGNDVTSIIGTPQYPVTLTHAADTGQAFAGLNYYRVNVTWESCEPAVLV